MYRSLIPVILAGGKGERFWPLSRSYRPKQFLSLDGSGKTLLQSTADRLLPLADEGWARLWVVTSAQLADGVRGQLQGLYWDNLLVEPEGRDTAPAVAWATLEIARRYGEEAVVGFFPADHWIGDQVAFQKTIRAAVSLAIATDAIVTLGVRPTYPATGYGYIEQGQPVGLFGGWPTYRVSRFTEKPDWWTAQGFLSTGRYSWNSGMFVFRAGVFLRQLKKHAEEIFIPLKEKGPAAYPSLPKTSIDYALMEKTELGFVLPAEFGWDDLGDWNALERLLKGDKPNVEFANHVGMDTYRTILYDSDPEELIVTIGLEDVVVVRDRNVTLIVKKHRTQEIKQVLKLLQDDPKYKHML